MTSRNFRMSSRNFEFTRIFDLTRMFDFSLHNFGILSRTSVLSSNKTTNVDFVPSHYDVLSRILIFHDVQLETLTCHLIVLTV